jgi:hypothetical protein
MSLDDDAAKFGRHFQGGWQLGLLVARNVNKRAKPGKPPKSEQVRNKVSCAKFAELANVSERTVQWFYDAWQLAAEEGHCTPAELLMPGSEDPKLSGIDLRSHEFRELWRKYYREARPNAAGGARGEQTPPVMLGRAKSTIEKIDGLEGHDAETQTEICRLIDELHASITSSAVAGECNE